MSLNEGQLREIDALVAEHVMGWEWAEGCSGRVLIPGGDSSDSFLQDGKPSFRIPRYTEDWSAFGPLMEQVQKKFAYIYLRWIDRSRDKHNPSNKAGFSASVHIYPGMTEIEPLEDFPSVQIALCVGALKAIGVDVSVLTDK